MRDPGKPVNELIAQSGHFFCVFVEVFDRLFQRRRHARDGGHVFGAGAFAALLRAALDERSDRHARSF